MAGRGRHPHRPADPAHADHLHAVRGAGAGRGGGRPVPVPASSPRRPASASACCSPRRSRSSGSYSWMPHTGVVRVRAAHRHPRRPARRRPRHARRAAASPSSRWARRPGRTACSPRPSSARPSASSPCWRPAATWRAAVIGSFIAAIIGLSIVVVTGYAGQVSLAQLALAGVAAFTLSYFTQSWNIPFPIAPILAALRGRGRRRAHRPARRCGCAGSRSASSRWRSRTRSRRCGSSNTDIVSSSGARVDAARAVRPRPQHRRRQGLPPDRVRPGLPLHARRRWRSASPSCARSSLGSAMLAVRANERSAAGVGVNVVWVKVDQLRHRLVHRRPRRQPPRLPAHRGDLRLVHGPRRPGLLSTAYLAGVTSVWGGIMAGILAATGIVFLAVGTWVHLGDWYAVIMGVLLIVTLITNPEGLAGSGHKFAAAIARRRAGVSQRRRGDGGDARRRTDEAEAEVAPRSPPARTSLVARASPSATAAWSPSTTSRSRSRPGPSSGSSARTAPARRA